MMEKRFFTMYGIMMYYIAAAQKMTPEDSYLRNICQMAIISTIYMIPMAILLQILMSAIL